MPSPGQIFILGGAWEGGGREEEGGVHTNILEILEYGLSRNFEPKILEA